MADINCPYCNHGQEVCHDDGEGYSEDEAHQMECYECEKTFVFHTSISFDYEPEKADCLNEGGNHDFQTTCTVPREYTKMRCSVCEETRPCTDAEKKELGHWYGLNTTESGEG